MVHATANKAKLLGRVRRLKGQMAAIERALEEEATCAEVLNLAASVRGAVNGLVAELIEDHIRNHVVDPASECDLDRARGAAVLLDIIGKYLK